MSRVGQVVNTAVLSALLIAGPGTAFAQWPQFRGPNGSGIDSSAAYPVNVLPREERRLEDRDARRPVVSGPGRRACLSHCAAKATGC